MALEDGAECQHNWLYWRGHSFVGIGAGAHGFVADGTDIGLRYSYPGDLRQFLKISASNLPTATDTEPQKTGRRHSPRDVVAGTGGTVDETRDLKPEVC